jgi:hypothetical protein
VRASYGNLEKVVEPVPKSECLAVVIEETWMTLKNQSSLKKYSRAAGDLSQCTNVDAMAGGMWMWRTQIFSLHHTSRDYTQKCKYVAT